MAKVLTVYYSRTGENYFPGGMKSIKKGNTAYAAEYIQKAVGGDLFEIEPVKAYSDNYRTCCDEAKAELESHARPAIKAYVEDISAYDTIFVCYPNWWSTVPMCVLTFLEHYDLTGKKIVPLCTNEGSGMGSSEGDLKRACKGASVASGLSVRGHRAETSEKEIAAWAKKNV